MKKEEPFGLEVQLQLTIRKALFTITIAFLLLVFSAISMVIISNISNELYRTEYYLDKGKEEPFGKIAVGSMVNALAYFDDYSVFTTGDSTSLSFSLNSSTGLRSSVLEEASKITFTTSATLIYTTGNFFEIITIPSTVTDEISTSTGAIVSFK